MLKTVNKKAFTLIELIVVIVILGLLAALAVPTFKSIIDQAKLQTEFASLQAAARNQVANAAFSQGTFKPDAVQAAFNESAQWDISQAKPAHSSELNYAISEEGNALAFTTVSQKGDSCLTTLASSQKIEVKDDPLSEVSCLAVDALSTNAAPPAAVVNTPTTPTNPNTPVAPSAGILKLTYNTASPSCSTIILPIFGTTGNGFINWGDGRTSDFASFTGNPSHVYSGGNQVEVLVQGKFGAFNGTPSTGECLISVNQWENTGTISMGFAYANTVNLQSVVAPPLSVTDMPFVFANSSFNGSLNHWNVSNVTNMSHMFANSARTGGLASWNTGNVKDMSGMFMDARSFNENISSWNTASLVNSSSMFSRASTFNQPLNWNMSKLEDASLMFSMASSFNSNISSSNTAELKNTSGMFYLATSFNQPLNWNTSKVKDMSNMFSLATSFNQNISAWDVRQVEDASTMFFGAEAFNQPLNSWQTTSLVKAPRMFNMATSFNQNLNSWDVSKVRSANSMFSGATAFNVSNISSWNTNSIPDWNM